MDYSKMSEIELKGLTDLRIQIDRPSNISEPEWLLMKLREFYFQINNCISALSCNYCSRSSCPIMQVNSQQILFESASTSNRVLSIIQNDFPTSSTIPLLNCSAPTYLELTMTYFIHSLNNIMPNQVQNHNTFNMGEFLYEIRIHLSRCLHVYLHLYSHHNVHFIQLGLDHHFTCALHLFLSFLLNPKLEKLQLLKNQDFILIPPQLKEKILQDLHTSSFILPFSNLQPNQMQHQPQLQPPTIQSLLINHNLSASDSASTPNDIKSNYIMPPSAEHVRLIEESELTLKAGEMRVKNREILKGQLTKQMIERKSKENTIIQKRRIERDQRSKALNALLQQQALSDVSQQGASSVKSGEIREAQGRLDRQILRVTSDSMTKLRQEAVRDPCLLIEVLNENRLATLSPDETELQNNEIRKRLLDSTDLLNFNVQFGRNVDVEFKDEDEDKSISCDVEILNDNIQQIIQQQNTANPHEDTSATSTGKVTSEVRTVSAFFSMMIRGGK